MDNTFILKVYEPFSPAHKIHVCRVEELPLEDVLLQLNIRAQYCTVNREKLLLEWKEYIPQKDDTILVFPYVGVKEFSTEYINELNKQSRGGIFVKAVDVVEDPGTSTIRYFVDHEQPITFNGNIYSPIFMDWSGFEVEHTMQLPQMGVTVPALKDQVITWAEEMDVRENDIFFRILHLSLLSDPVAQHQFRLQIQTITGDQGVAIFNCGMNLGFDDDLPRGTIKKSKYPGVPDSTSRILI